MTDPRSKISPDDPRLCRHLGHVWPTKRVYFPVYRPVEPTWKPEPVDIKPTKIEAYAEQWCQRRCGQIRVLDYDDNVVDEYHASQQGADATAVMESAAPARLG